ncbi:DNA topoisomerase 2-like [Nicotiana tabacum]|uniref:DNA topoisomerase 2 n=1 Tax=Nicotiana tabacum TaxID=4097 RepID=Q8GSC4_TOBAC|nr:DNA topoisomerase 2-like [Nicotiana tabacum]AAN85207.1 DNA topoisomerase II [Nicotiana tabacum]AAN85208.1 DNA topoisomerase II [Nicotiana tabacum]
MASKKLPLQSSSNANIATNGKTIEQTYQKKTQLEHILLRPDTYIGSVEKHTQTLWVWENDKMTHRPVTYVPGLYKIFDEILVNAADNKQRDPKMDAVEVVIDPEQNFISVYNNGDGIPVEIHQEEGVYVPELIFGHLLTSSNYDDAEKKTTGGRNGYGAKLTNIFSTEFVIETADGKRQKKYKQVFSSNMGKKGEPIITKCKASENWTKVSSKPDLAKFNMEHLEEDVVALMRKRVIDLGGCLGKTVKVKLNEQRIPVKSFEEYCKLFLDSTDAKREFLKVTDADGLLRWEICVSLSEGQFQQVSFVNSIATIKGGTHVDYVANQIANHIMGAVIKKNKNANIKAHAVKNHLWMFVNALIDNPAFDSQTKETLTLRQSSFGSKCELQPDFLKKVEKNIGIVETLLSWADFKNSKDLKKTDGKKSEKVKVEKLEDANDAGGRNSEKCTLILTEGDSAKALAMAGISVVGRDHYGVFPLRGKLLNVREASHKQVSENKEIEAIKKILGLQTGKEYDSVKSLRYGHLMIMTDQDHDGSHIKGLLINFIHTFWPSLLKVPSFLIEFITPIVKATHKSGKILSFYTMPEYESWRKSLGANSSGWSIKYYKGLGTSTSKEGKEYFQDLQKHRKDFIWADNQDGESIELAFSKKKIEARKNWLRQFEPGTHLDQKEKYISYTEFVNKELILFSMADLQRSIPSMLDGLKPGQRKILFCAFKRNFVKEAKVSQFSGYVSEHSAYHHGEQSLSSTIIGMAQDYVGSNNVNLLQPNGQFGTRNMGGKDHASSRYIYTRLSPIARFLFPKEDDTIHDYLNEDGQYIEPTWYVPIVPMVLINGSEGIGTGWSSYVPNYNPRDLVANVRRLLNDEPMEPMDPWYKGFKGTIEKTATKEAGATYTVTGIIEEVNETTLRISELPVRRWTEDYKQFLESMTVSNDKAKDPFIKEVRAYGDENSVCFEVIMSEENLILAQQEGLLKKFKLATTISTSNMHLFDSNGKIKKYDNPEDILEEFYHVRLEYYEKRKKALLEILELELLRIENKVKFILGVVKVEIIVNNRKRADLLLELKEKGFTPFPKKKAVEAVVADTSDDAEDSEEELNRGVRAGDYDYLLSMPIGTLTLEKVQELCAERDQLNGEVEDMRNATPKLLWLKDLDVLEKQLDEQDKIDIQAEEAREKIKKKVMNAAGLKAPKPKPRKNVKKASVVESTAEPMDRVSCFNSGNRSNVTEVVKPKARGGSKKAPAKAKPIAVEDEEEEEDDEVLALKDRLAAYNLNSSPDHSAEAMETEAPKAQKKAPTRKAAAKKKTLPSIADVSEGEDEIEISDDDESEPEVAVGGKKKGGRKPATAKAAPAAAKQPPKKRGPANKQAVGIGQKLITSILKPAENTDNSSPEKKVRKMRASPFNEKSGAVLGKNKGSTLQENEDASPVSSLGSLEDEVNEAVVAPKARVTRGKKTTYVISDSDNEDNTNEFEPTDDSEFDGDDSDEDYH